MTCSGLAIRGKLEGFQLKGHLIHTSFSIHRRAICLQDISPEIPLEEESVMKRSRQLPGINLNNRRVLKKIYRNVMLNEVIFFSRLAADSEKSMQQL